MHRKSCTMRGHCGTCIPPYRENDYDFTADTLKMLDKRLIGRLHCYEQKCECENEQEDCCECEHEELCLKQVRRLNNEELEKRRMYEDWWEHKAIRGGNEYRNIEHCKCVHQPNPHKNHNCQRNLHEQRNCSVSHTMGSALGSCKRSFYSFSELPIRKFCLWRST